MGGTRFMLVNPTKTHTNQRTYLDAINKMTENGYGLSSFVFWRILKSDLAVEGFASTFFEMLKGCARISKRVCASEKGLIECAQDYTI